MQRFKRGTLEKRKTSRGLGWYLRYTDAIGEKVVRPRVRLGLVSELPSRSAAWRAAQPILQRLNEPSRTNKLFGDVLDRYIAEEIPSRYSTQKGYRSMIKVHIRPKWAKMPILEVRPYAVRAWLRGLKCGPCRQGHIQDLMRVIFRNAMLWEWMPQGENPMKLFSIRGSSKRLKEPGTLTLEQIHALLEKLPGEPYRTMVVAAQGLGIRLSELMGLRWSDLNFAAGRIRIVRAIVEGHVGEVKTIHSAKELPLHSKLAEIFQAWQGLTEYKGSEHYVFASPFSDGEMPYSGGKIQSKILRPAGQELGLDFSLGWHTFRHTYRAMLRATGAPLDVQRDLMRHADIQTTAQVYGATKVDELRRINSMVIERLFNKEGGWPAQSNTR